MIAYDYSDAHREPSAADLARIAQALDRYQECRAAVTRAQGVPEALHKAERDRRLAKELLIESLCDFRGAGPMRELELPDGRVIQVRRGQRAGRLDDADLRAMRLALRQHGRYADEKALAERTEGQERRRREHDVRSRLAHDLPDVAAALGLFDFDVSVVKNTATSG
ncbi:MAG: hypothetical protein IPK26_10915 [Planctomycetes bacterium]|nr:hypothetical protein [Planctomycetota bacterium]